MKFPIPVLAKEYHVELCCPAKDCQKKMSEKREAWMVLAVSFVNCVVCRWQPQWLTARLLPTQQWTSLSAPRSHLPTASPHWTADPPLAHTCWRCRQPSSDSKTHWETAAQPGPAGLRTAQRSGEPTLVRQVQWAARGLQRMTHTVSTEVTFALCCHLAGLTCALHVEMAYVALSGLLHALFSQRERLCLDVGNWRECKRRGWLEYTFAADRGNSCVFIVASVCLRGLPFLIAHHSVLVSVLLLTVHRRW